MAKYLLEEEPLTCIGLEKELGLNPGDIRSLTVHAGGAVEIETKVDLSTIVQDKLKTALQKRNLPRGKKPV